MPTYIVLGRLTQQAKTDMAQAMKSRDEVLAEFGKKGVRVTPYMTLGAYDYVNIVEAPTEELMMKFLMAAGSRGNVETTTLRAFTPQDLEKVQRA